MVFFLVPIHSGCCPTAPGVTTKHENCNKDEDNPTEAAQAKAASNHFRFTPALAPPLTLWSEVTAQSEWTLLSGTPLWTGRV